MVFDFRTKKKFGQHFLVNTKLQERVILELKNTLNSNIKKIIEIGPGRGDLTQHLSEFSQKIELLEIDEEAVETLTQKFSENSNIEIHLLDALEILEEGDKNNFFSQDSLLFSNLPFNVGSRILVSLAIQQPAIPFVLIFQKEVADKFNPKNKMTFLGAWINLFWQVKQVFLISKGNFSPPPKVMSALITGEPKFPNWLEDFQSRLNAKNTLKSLFAQPKKTVQNNLKNAGWSELDIQTFFEKNNYPSNMRLNWSNYQEILKNLSTQFPTTTKLDKKANLL